MREKRKNCKDMSIVNREDLMIDGEYLDKEGMESRCHYHCFYKQICRDILIALSKGDWQKAESLIPKEKLNDQT